MSPTPLNPNTRSLSPFGTRAPTLKTRMSRVHLRSSWKSLRTNAYRATRKSGTAGFGFTDVIRRSSFTQPQASGEEAVLAKLGRVSLQVANEQRWSRRAATLRLQSSVRSGQRDQPVH